MDRRFDVRSKVMLAQAGVSRDLVAGFLSSLEAFVHPFAGSLQKSSREVPYTSCAGMTHLSAAFGQILMIFFLRLFAAAFQDLAKSPQFERGCDGRCLSGKSGSEAGGHGDLVPGPQEQL